MAERPLFIPTASGRSFVRTININFNWSPGFSLTQKQKSIRSLHESAAIKFGISNILEVSTKSNIKLGVNLSAFNLKNSFVHSFENYPVENIFQSSKVFAYGGPYKDLLQLSPAHAKKDSRLRESGSLTGFSFFGENWPLEPVSAFYDWIYINSLISNEYLEKQVLNFEAFTDIEFNPKKSINCQAYSLALYVSLRKRGISNTNLKCRDKFLKLVQENSREFYQADINTQGLLF